MNHNKSQPTRYLAIRNTIGYTIQYVWQYDMLAMWSSSHRIWRCSISWCFLLSKYINSFRMYNYWDCDHNVTHSNFRLLRRHIFKTIFKTTVQDNYSRILKHSIFLEHSFHDRSRDEPYYSLFRCCCKKSFIKISSW